ncbi:MAG: response regulator transcription factor [Steroidobacteraceae bacterium]
MAEILIVEDNAAHVRALTDQFTDLGHKVFSARDGDSGLRQALEKMPDVLILDIMLPRKNGYEVCAAIRAHGSDVPILMLTAKDQEEDVVQGLELGADDYVTKPFRVNELTARVNALLRRNTVAPQEIRRFGDYELNGASRQLTKKGEIVELTRKEFGLLKLFLDKPNRALTRNQIMKVVWGNRILVTPRSVDRCVTTLRAKIESDPANAVYIQTIRDIGYRFCLLESDHGNKSMLGID